MKMQTVGENEVEEKGDVICSYSSRVLSVTIVLLPVWTTLPVKTSVLNSRWLCVVMESRVVTNNCVPRQLASSKRYTHHLRNAANAANRLQMMVAMVVVLVIRSVASEMLGGLVENCFGSTVAKVFVQQGQKRTQMTQRKRMMRKTL